MIRIGTEFKSVRSALATTDAYAKRWEQEYLVTAVKRQMGSGTAELGIYIPHDITLQNVHYRFTTPTTSGTTTGTLYLNMSTSLPPASKMNVAANAISQTVTGLSIDINAGSRVSLIVDSAGSSGVGWGLYVSFWGVYR